VIISRQSASLYQQKTIEKQGETHASFNWRACSGESIPRVVQTSMPIPRTSRTIFRILSKPLFRPARSLHAAPMQNRVLPFSLAFRAASRTGSTSRRREAEVGVEYRADCEQYEPMIYVHIMIVKQYRKGFTILRTAPS